MSLIIRASFFVIATATGAGTRALTRFPGAADEAAYVQTQRLGHRGPSSREVAFWLS
jgi:hypothetical protein